MYNLFISGNNESWDGDQWETEKSRCVREYTEQEITDTLGVLDAQSIAKLKKLPCLFAYEMGHNKDPRFGRILNVHAGIRTVSVDYQIEPVRPFLTAANLLEMANALGIERWELYRTHWAVKEVNLPRELASAGITLPPWASRPAQAVNILNHNFEVALSFPGEARAVVEPVARELERIFGPNTYFYDNNYTAQLARPDLDVILQGIYGNRSKLLVVFLSADYQRKRWCNVEFRSIRPIISNKAGERVMFIRMDPGEVDGVFATDGYVDGTQYTPHQLAEMIQERVELLE